MGEILSRTRCKRAELWNRAQLEIEFLAELDAQIIEAVKCPQCLAAKGTPCHVFGDPSRPVAGGPHLERQRSYDRYRGWITYLRPQKRKAR